MDILKDILNPIRASGALRMLLVTLRACAPSLFLLGALAGCNRDFESPLLSPVRTDSVAPIITIGTTDTAQSVVVIPPAPVLIESFAAEEMRFEAGKTMSPAISVLPANATSPIYEMISGKPSVAEVRAEGIYGKAAGTATISIKALDGSGRTGAFKVTVDEAPPAICLLSPCLCLTKPKEKEKCLEDAD
jgi:hypothetical protein